MVLTLTLYIKTHTNKLIKFFKVPIEKCYILAIWIYLRYNGFEEDNDQRLLSMIYMTNLSLHSN